MRSRYRDNRVDEIQCSKITHWHMVTSQKAASTVVHRSRTDHLSTENTYQQESLLEIS